MNVKVVNGINYPLLDSLSEKGQRLYLFMLTQNGKKIDLDGYSAILHMTKKEICDAFVEILLAESETKGA